MAQKNDSNSQQVPEDPTQNMPSDISTEEQIGIHKGALSTLNNERNELARLVGICDQLIQMHVKSLKDLGVDLEAQAQQAQESQGQKGEGSQQDKTSKRIDELL